MFSCCFSVDGCCSWIFGIAVEGRGVRFGVVRLELKLGDEDVVLIWSRSKGMLIWFVRTL
jgi:predicted ester cyclase